MPKIVTVLAFAVTLFFRDFSLGLFFATHSKWYSSFLVLTPHLFLMHVFSKTATYENSPHLGFLTRKNGYCEDHFWFSVHFLFCLLDYMALCVRAWLEGFGAAAFGSRNRRFPFSRHFLLHTSAGRLLFAALFPSSLNWVRAVLWPGGASWFSGWSFPWGDQVKLDHWVRANIVGRWRRCRHVRHDLYRHVRHDLYRHG